MTANRLSHGGHVLTAREVCQYLRIPLSTLYSLSKRGRIKGVKVGKHWRYLQEDVHDFLVHPVSDKHGNQTASANGQPLLISDSNPNFKHLGVGDSVRIVFKIPENGRIISFEMEGQIVEKESQADKLPDQRGAA